MPKPKKNHNLISPLNKLSNKHLQKLNNNNKVLNNSNNNSNNNNNNNNNSKRKDPSPKRNDNLIIKNKTK